MKQRLSATKIRTKYGGLTGRTPYRSEGCLRQCVGFFTSNGYRDLYIVEERMNLNKYCDLVKKAIISSMLKSISPL